MLNSQHRKQPKKTMLTHRRRSLLFFVLQPCPKTANASLSGAPQKGRRGGSYLCHLPPVGQWQSLRQQGSFANLLFFENPNCIKTQSQRYCGMPPHKAAKRLRHKNSKPTAQKPSFLFRFLLALAHAANGWSLSIFCCILFFILIKF